MNITKLKKVIQRLYKARDYEWDCIAYPDGEWFEADGFKLKNVERHGGREGAGSDHWIVFSADDGNEIRTFKMDGWYASYEGSYIDPDTLHEVEEVKAVKSEWRAKK